MMKAQAQKIGIFVKWLDVKVLGISTTTKVQTVEEHVLRNTNFAHHVWSGWIKIRVFLQSVTQAWEISTELHVPVLTMKYIYYCILCQVVSADCNRPLHGLAASKRHSWRPNKDRKGELYSIKTHRQANRENFVWIIKGLRKIIGDLHDRKLKIQEHLWF